jgi:hypothetical protein
MRPRVEPLEHGPREDETQGDLGLVRLARRALELGRHRLGDLLRRGRLAPGRGERERGLAVVRRRRTGTWSARQGRALHTVVFPAIVGVAMIRRGDRVCVAKGGGFSAEIGACDA